VITDYYHETFRQDLQDFLGEVPLPYFGHGWPFESRSQLARVPASRREEFVLCLYLTVLADQAMYTHGGAFYREFAALTQAPKFCHGLCQFQHNPRGILLAAVERGAVSRDRLVELLPDAMALLVAEMTSFFAEHGPGVSAQGFFEKLRHDPDVVIPELLVIVEPSLRDDVGYLAHCALREAMDRWLNPTPAVREDLASGGGDL
jgi:hypothetical protein